MKTEQAPGQFYLRLNADFINDVRFPSVETAAEAFEERLAIILEEWAQVYVAPVLTVWRRGDEYGLEVHSESLELGLDASTVLLMVQTVLSEKRPPAAAGHFVAIQKVIK